MTNKSGVTLLEVIVVIAIITIISAIAIPNYNKWRRQYSIEGDVKAMYGLIQTERTKAFSQKLSIDISINNDNVNVVEKNGLSGTVLDNYTTTLKNKFSGGPVSIDTRGTLSGPSIYHDSSAQGLSPQYDCLSIDDIRVALGKWDGSKCNAE